MNKIFALLALLLIFSCNKVEKEPATEEPVLIESTEAVSIDWTKNLTIYEVNVRQFTKEGTFNAFAEHLPRLKDMGLGILWFMPVQPIGEEKRKGSLGSYYSIKDYKGINPEFGTMADFKNLVDEAHELGMFVIIDWVANHSSWDCNLVDEHPEWYTKDEEGNMIPPVPDWSDVADLNYDDKGLWKYMTEAMLYWVEEAGIDGFRCDVAGEVPLEFWQESLDELQKVNPEIFMLAEHEDPVDHNDAFHATYAWEMHHIMNEMAKGKKTMTDLHTYFIKEDENYPQSAYRLQFTSNHDENSWNGTVEERMGGAGNAFAVLSSTVEQSMPLIYNGQEAGLNKRLAFFEKDEIIWQDHPMNEFYSKLISLKLENEALWNGEYGGDMEIIPNNNDNNVLAFIREKNNDKVLVVVNLSENTSSVKLDNENEGEMTELFSETKVAISEDYQLNLPPWGYQIYSN